MDRTFIFFPNIDFNWISVVTMVSSNQPSQDLDKTMKNKRGAAQVTTTQFGVRSQTVPVGSNSGTLVGMMGQLEAIKGERFHPLCQR